MSVFDEQFSEGAALLLLDQLGSGAETASNKVTYHPADGSDDVTLVAIVDALKKTLEEGAENKRLIRTLRVTFSTDPSSGFGGVADPSEQAQLTVGGVKYKVKRGSIEIAGGMATLEVMRPVVTAKRRPGYVGT